LPSAWQPETDTEKSYCPEFVSRALPKWPTGQKIDMALIDPCKPWQNGAAESALGRFPYERLL
jgi:putative transposase